MFASQTPTHRSDANNRDFERNGRASCVRDASSSPDLKDHAPELFIDKIRRERLMRIAFEKAHCCTRCP